MTSTCTLEIPRKDFCFYHNSSFSVILRARAKSGDPIDFTGRKILCQIRTSRDSPDIIAEYSSEGTPPEFTVGDNTNELKWFVNSDKVTSLLPRSYVYDVFEYGDEQDTDKKARLRGTIEVVSSVTRFE
jgi:hypothetical protein